MLLRLSQATTQSELTAPAPSAGGGLLTLVKEGIVFQRAAEYYSPALEILTIQVLLPSRIWATIHIIGGASKGAHLI